MQLTYILTILLMCNTLFGMESDQPKKYHNFNLEHPTSCLFPVDKKLWQAVEVHNFKAAQEALNEGASLNSDFFPHNLSSVEYPLMDIACDRNDSELFKFLLLNNASTSQRNRATLRILNKPNIKIFLTYAQEKDIQQFVREATWNWGDATYPVLRSIFYYKKFNQTAPYADYMQKLLCKAAGDKREDLVKLLLFYETGIDYLIRSKGYIRFLNTNKHLNWIKLVSINPENVDEYLKDPVKYRKQNPQEFNPLQKYPYEFVEEIEWYNQEKLRNIKEKNGSVLRYLQKRELGINNFSKKSY